MERDFDVLEPQIWNDELEENLNDEFTDGDSGDFGNIYQGGAIFGG